MIKRKVKSAGSKQNPGEHRQYSLMEDIMNSLRNVKNVELKEEIEYFWERVDPKSKQKYYRFFFITSKNPNLNLIITL